MANYMGAGFLADTRHSTLTAEAREGPGHRKLHRPSGGRHAHRGARGSGMHEAQAAGAGAKTVHGSATPDAGRTWQLPPSNASGPSTKQHTSPSMYWSFHPGARGTLFQYRLSECTAKAGAPTGPVQVPGQLSPEAQPAVQLPLQNAGLGLRSAEATLHAAY